MTFQEAQQRYEAILADAVEMLPGEAKVFSDLIGQSLARFAGTMANPNSLTLADFDIVYVVIPPLYWMPITQRHAVIQSRKTGRSYMSDLSLAFLGGGWVMCGEMSNLSK